MADFKNIPLKSIMADENQPRRFFDETALQELTDSVRINGILQPVMVRPNPSGLKDKYLLVCGERRFRAAIAVMTLYKDRNTIPAVIRELTDEQALELQIVENLQRKDVHPMEEAVAFKSLLDHKQFSVHEIAARVGKSDFYVRQRLKLNDLTEAWQKAFFANHIALKDAMLIFQLPVQAQDSLYKSKNVEKCHPGSWIKIDTWDVDGYRGELQKAAFDLTDITLNEKAGACTSCNFNTAVSVLFPEEEKAPRCMNVSCFHEKNKKHFESQLKTALEDPSVILAHNTYGNIDGMAKKLKDEGSVIYKLYDDYTSVDAPEKPDLLELREQYEYELEEGDKTEKDIEQEFSELQVQYDKKLAEYNKKMSSGKFKKAFVLTGSEKGKYIYVQLKDKGQVKTAKAALEAGESISTTDIDTEITRLQEREKRAKELDAEKVHAIIKETILNSSSFQEVRAVNTFTPELSRAEIVAASISLWQAGSLSYRREIVKMFSTLKPKEIRGYDVYTCKPELVEYFKDMTILSLYDMLRSFMLDKLIGNGGSRFVGGDDLALHNLALQYEPDAVNKVLLEQEEIAIKRAKRVEDRITELQKQKEELQPAKPASKKKLAKQKDKNETPLSKGISSLLNNKS
ncbi:ParB/RepB/Spo0J family partition protein [Chitinophaga tropicalis]|uniref:ParB/RepB/Spo0J family partition protein n=1 Tax=Chitinophaga tropicalis TaxID=2683588 RepID=A0A7K1UAF0_9BACT|nr:ParB/RepB/Spo0J family partition protein [Chitinophaga tropicalis]MVT11351.1 ParB/RepB/Spo0J family partition protein [Chitinophaga tropicalis]